MLRTIALVLLLILPGVTTMTASGYFAVLDWDQLQADYDHFRDVSASDADFRDVFVAWASQDIHRKNLAADGIWFLLGALPMGLGVHGLCASGAAPQTEVSSRGGGNHDGGG